MCLLSLRGRIEGIYDLHTLTYINRKFKRVVVYVLHGIVGMNQVYGRARPAMCGERQTLVDLTGLV